MFRCHIEQGCMTTLGTFCLLSVMWRLKSEITLLYHQPTTSRSSRTLFCPFSCICFKCSKAVNSKTVSNHCFWSWPSTHECWLSGTSLFQDKHTHSALDACLSCFYPTGVDGFSFCLILWNLRHLLQTCLTSSSSLGAIPKITGFFGEWFLLACFWPLWKASYTQCTV